MREILFRGKRVDNGEWVYGFYNFTIFDDGSDELMAVIKQHIIADENGYVWSIDKNTVGQFTGLTDKNGTKIFEGDIIKNDSTHDLEIVIENGHTIVKFIDFGCRHKEMIYSDYIKREELEVIGNIHEKGETK